MNFKADRKPGKIATDHPKIPNPHCRAPPIFTDHCALPVTVAPVLKVLLFGFLSIADVSLRQHT